MQRDVTAMKVIVQPFLGVRAMTSSGAHENGLKQKLANLLETIAHPWPRELITEGDEQLGDFFSCLRGVAIVRHSQHVCLRVVTIRSLPIILPLCSIHDFQRCSFILFLYYGTSQPSREISSLRMNRPFSIGKIIKKDRNEFRSFFFRV